MTTDLQVIVRGTALSPQAADDGPPLVLEFADDAPELFGGADPIRLRFADGTRSNVIFPCVRANLSATLRASVESDERLSRIGHLDLDDDELLLQELEATMVLALVREQHSDAQLLALVYVLARDARLDQQDDLRVRIRDAWRALLLGRRLAVDRVVIRDADVLLRLLQPPEGPPLAEVVEELRLLADYRSRPEFIYALDDRFAASQPRWYFDNVAVRIPSRWEDANVECVTVDDSEIILTLEDAQWALVTWMQVESRSYYRVQVRSRRSPTTRFVAFYEPGSRRGRYAAPGSGGEFVVLTNPHAPGGPWEDAILELMIAAEEEDSARAAASVERASG